jgi:ATP-dependent protease ClpP protease subunit
MKIDIFGDIIGGESERWSAGDFATSDIVDALRAANGEAVEVNINSNGGSVTGGIAIANAIKQYPGETTCNVLGVAASIASVIACACDNLRMGEGSFLMIHNPFTVTMGTADDLRSDADTLDKMRDAIISFYRAKCDKSEDELKALMDAETWLSRDEAKAGGWAVTDYEGELKAAASLTRRAFDHAPEAARAFLSVAEKKADAPREEKPAENWEARFKGLSTKYNEVKAEYDARLDALAAENKQLKDQLDQTTHDLADAKAKVSELAAKVEEGAKTLLDTKAELARTRDSLAVAEDKAKHLEETRDLLTAGVLTPPTPTTYADKMKSAKTPEERESLRAQKRAGKIK